MHRDWAHPSTSFAIPFTVQVIANVLDDVSAVALVRRFYAFTAQSVAAAGASPRVGAWHSAVMRCNRLAHPRVRASD
jgi:hypothetical protein